MNEVFDSFLFPVTYLVKSEKNHAMFFKKRLLPRMEFLIINIE